MSCRLDLQRLDSRVSNRLGDLVRQSLVHSSEDRHYMPPSAKKSTLTKGKTRHTLTSLDLSTLDIAKVASNVRHEVLTGGLVHNLVHKRTRLLKVHYPILISILPEDE